MLFKTEIEIKVRDFVVNIPKIIEANNIKEANLLIFKWQCSYLGIFEDDVNASFIDKKCCFGESDSINWTDPVEITKDKWLNEIFSRSLIKRTDFN